MLFNAMIETRPRYVARCSSADDVAAALAFAARAGPRGRRARRRPRRRRPARCARASCSTCAGSTTSRSTRSRRIARVGGGATWAQVDRATQAHGLATTGGRVSTHRRRRAHARRRLGLARAQARPRLRQPARRRARDRGRRARARLRDREPRAAVGAARRRRQLRRRHRARADAAPGRPGGARRHRRSTRRSAPRELLRAFRDVMRDAPDELSLAYVAPHDPRGPRLPGRSGRPARPSRSPGMWAGEVADGERGAAPACAASGARSPTSSAPMPYADFQCSLDDPPGYRNYWTAEQADDLPGRARSTRSSRHCDGKPGGSVAAVPRRLGRRDGADRRRALAARRARRALRRAPALAVGGPGRRRARDRLVARLPRADGPVPDRRRRT